MKKVRFLALLVAMMMMASLAFAETADEDPIVVKAGDAVVRLSEAQAIFDDYYSAYEELYAENGMVMSSDEVDYLLTAIVDMLSQTAVMDSKIAEYGLGDITDADKEALRVEVDAAFESDLAAYALQLGMSVEEARELVAEQGITADSIFEANLEDLPYMRLYEYVVKDVTVSDEDVQKEYDAYVEEDKAAYESDIASYEMYSLYYGGDDIFYMPSGYRLIKHILLTMPEDVAAEMNDYDTDMKASQKTIDALNDELKALETPDAESETEPRSAEDIQADLDAEQAKYDELKTKYDDARAQIVPSLQPIIDEIHGKLADGSTFDELIVEYGADPGTESNPDGYKVHKDSVTWDNAFRDAAMALEAIGDTSDPVLSAHGVHILLYADDAPSGAIELSDAVAESIRTSMLSAVQDEAFYAQFDEWVSATDVETHPELIQLPEAPAAEETEAPADEATEEEAPEADDAGDDEATTGDN